MRGRRRKERQRQTQGKGLIFHAVSLLGEEGGWEGKVSRVCCIIWLCSGAWIIDTLPRNRGPIPGNRGETDREFKLGGSISPLLAPCVCAFRARRHGQPRHDRVCTFRSEQIAPTPPPTIELPGSKDALYTSLMYARQSLSRVTNISEFIHLPSRPINSSPTSSFLVQSFLSWREDEIGIRVFSRDTYLPSPFPSWYRDERIGVYGKREKKKKMMEEKIRKKKEGREQFSAFSSTLLPAPFL